VKNLLADIPKQITHLEALHHERGCTVTELRDKYCAILLRQALNGPLMSENHDVRRLPHLKHSVSYRAGNVLPDFPSRYHEWLQRLPLRDIENYAKQLIQTPEQFPFITYSNQRKKTLNNKIRQGVYPVSVVCRLPIKFLSETTDGQKHCCEITAGSFQIIYIFHINPKGLTANKGFHEKNFRLRIFCRNPFLAPRLINHFHGHSNDNVRKKMCEGNYENALENLLTETNKIIQKLNFQSI